MNKKSKLLSLIQKIYNYFIDLLFPKFCVGCKLEGVWICKNCLKKIIYIKKPTCPLCNKITPNGQFCRSCRQKTYLTGVIIAAYYNEGPLKEAIHTYKYENVFDISGDLSKILIEVLVNRWHRKAIIIPVPLHKKKERERGFNQSELIARKIAEKLNYQLSIKKLIRIKYTDPQIKLSGKNRRENIKKAFFWNGKNEIKGKTILLVDDIYTTGATLNECGKILRENGAREVWGLVLAKA